MKYSTLIKQGFIIIKSKWIFQLLKGRFLSLSSFEVVSNINKMVPELNTIIDVGANSGQFTNAANLFYPNANFVVFEPLPDLYLKIQRMFQKNKNIITNNIALGNEIGSIRFNKNKYGHISSVLDISEENQHYPKDSMEQIDVEIQTLDSFFKNLEIKSPSLLKLDVQGFELEVLKGSLKSFEKIDYIVIEANLEQLYVNQPSFTEVNQFLNSHNFEIMGMLDFNLGNKNKFIEIDLLYKKRLN